MTRKGDEASVRAFRRPRTLIAALVLALLSTEAGGQVPLLIDRATGDSALRRLKRDIGDALIAGIMVQRQAWQAVELREHGAITRQPDREPERQRLAMMHCHTDERFSPSTYALGRRTELVMRPDGRSETRPVEDQPYPVPTMVRSRVPLVALCPNWVPTQRAGTKPGHELRGTDLDPARIAPFSDSLVAALRRAADAYPDEPFFVGQLTRVLVDNGRPDEAREQVVRCRASPQWCGLLGAYAAYAAGRVATTDTLFRGILATMSPDARCDMLFVHPLLSPSDSAAYGALPCTVRDVINLSMFWLATPFFSDRSNLRMTVHMARRVRNALVGQIGVDVHHDLRTAVGGDAVVAMRTRYGWPTHMAWPGPGPGHEVDHIGYQGARNAPPFSAPEYARQVVMLLPPLAVAGQSIASGEWVDWLLTISGRGSMGDVAPPWPREFMSHPAGAVFTSRIGQAVLLRRDTTARFIAAGVAAISWPLASLVRDSSRVLQQGSVRTMLAFSSGPDDMRVLDSVMTAYGGAFQVAGESTRPGLFAVETRVGRGGVDGTRARYGTPELPTTRAIRPGECALSQPALIASRDARTATDGDVRLLPSVTLTNRDVGVMWESYGVQLADTVTVTMEVRAEGRPSALGRVAGGAAPGRAQPQSILISWTEPSGGASARPISQATPTVERRLKLDLRPLKRGTYLLQIEITLPSGCQAVSEPRRFDVR